MAFRPDRALWGVPPLLALWAGALWLHLLPIEATLRMRLDGAGAPATGDVLSRSGARLEVDGRDVAAVTDVGLAPAVERSLMAAIASVEGVRHVSVSTPLPVALDPYPFTLRLGRTGLRLGGGVPSPAVHAALREAARAVASGPVDDRLRLATGAPAGFADAALRLVQLSGLLANGDLAVTGTVYSATGDARDFTAYNAARDLLAVPLRGFAPAEIAIRPPTVPSFMWSAERTGDIVTLDGFVPNEAARASALALARAAVPRGSVVDRSQTARGLDPAVSFDALAASALGALGRLQAGRVALAGRSVSASGESPARDLLAEIERDLRGGVAAGTDLKALDLRAVPADPFRLIVSRATGRVTLEGYLRDAALRTRLLALVARRFPAEAIVDRTHLADGAASGFATAAERGVTDLAELADGTLSLSGRDLRLTGRVLYGDVAARLATAVPAAAPPDWNAGTDIEGPGSAQPLDALQCADLLGDAARRQPVRFEPAGSALTSDSRPALENLTALLGRCPPVRLRLVRISAGTGEGDVALAKARASMLADALRTAGAGRGIVLEAEGEAAKAAGSERSEFRLLPGLPAR